jgi:hypothetical protein
MSRAVFSTTTMASSTTIPMASTSANSVSMLMLNPKASNTANEPMIDTGMATPGITVARPFWRKTNTVKNTRPAATSNVTTTSLIDAVTKSEKS